MYRKPFTRIQPDRESDNASATTNHSLVETTRLTQDQIERLADLIVKGVAHLPTNLESSDQEHLVIAIRQRLRDRMIRHIARTLAAKFRHEIEPKPEFRFHDREKI